MSTGWGVDAVKNSSGVATSGTSAQDIRKINYGMYNQGILYGCVVNTSTTAMTYTIEDGVVANELVAGETTLMPITKTTITVPANTGTTARTDYVYVKQNLPDEDKEGNNNIVFGVTNSEPAYRDQRLVLRKFIVPAGATTTSKATRTGSINYSTPYGQSGRLLVNKVDTYNGLLRNRQINELGGDFNLTTDRTIRVDITATYDLEPGQVGNDRLTAEIWVNNTKRATFSTGLIDTRTYTTSCWTWYTQLYRGENNITVKMYSHRKQVDGLPSVIYLRHSENGWPGQRVVVSDAGVLD